MVLSKQINVAILQQNLQLPDSVVCILFLRSAYGAGAKTDERRPAVPSSPPTVPDPTSTGSCAVEFIARMMWRNGVAIATIGAACGPHEATFCSAVRQPFAPPLGRLCRANPILRSHAVRQCPLKQDGLLLVSTEAFLEG